MDPTGPFAENDKAIQRSSRIRPYVLLALLAAICGAMAVSLLRLPATANDFAIYWAAGRKVLAGGNPYAPEHEILQRQIRFSGNEPLVLRNPPWALPVIIPFALLDYAPAQKLCLLVDLIAVVASVHWLVQLYGTARRHAIGWLAVATFLPVAVVLAIGQIGPLLLLGLAGFLHFEAKQKYACGGAFLYLLSLKPHLALLFWIAVVLYVVVHQRWKIGIGFLTVLGAMSAIAAAVDPAVFPQYWQLWRASSGFVSEVNPTVAGLLTLLARSHWAQFIPATLAGIWLVFYWRFHTHSWSWRDRTPMLLMVSMLVTWYGWFFDQVVLVPCVVQAVFCGSHLSRRLKVCFAITYLAINLSVLALILNHRTTFWYAWTMPAWLLLYLGVTMSREPAKAVVRNG